MPIFRCSQVEIVGKLGVEFRIVGTKGFILIFHGSVTSFTDGFTITILRTLLWKSTTILRQQCDSLSFSVTSSVEKLKNVRAFIFAFYNIGAQAPEKQMFYLIRR
jgi:hypothetical protein